MCYFWRSASCPPHFPFFLCRSAASSPFPASFLSPLRHDTNFGPTLVAPIESYPGLFPSPLYLLTASLWPFSFSFQSTDRPSSPIFRRPILPPLFPPSGPTRHAPCAPPFFFSCQGPMCESPFLLPTLLFHIAPTHHPPRPPPLSSFLGQQCPLHFLQED